MNKKEKIDFIYAISERYAKGQEFLSYRSIDSLFQLLKRVARKHINENSIPCLNRCMLYHVIINDNHIREMFFNFGGILNGYEVNVDAGCFTIRSRNPVSYKKVVYSCSTCDLTEN